MTDLDDLFDDLTGEPLGNTPRWPCRHPIGSPERLACYAKRAARGERLFHPGDARTLAEPNNRNTGTGLYARRSNREVV